MEIWKKIDNFDNYEISSLGRVKTADKIIVRTNGRPMPFPGRILKPYKDSKGYLHISIYNDAHIKHKFQIHRLVAKYFIPNPNNLPQVNHKDENKSNNCVDNLEWCTNNYNTNYGNRNYNLSRSFKNNSKTSKIILQYDKDKNLLKEWPSINEIRRSLNYGTAGIWKCCQGKQNYAYNYIWRYKEC